MEHIPSLSVDLINTLDKLYPEVLPRPGVCREKQLYAAGQRSVIAFLQQLMKEQEETIYVP